jgi:hypothetical protein
MSLAAVGSLIALALLCPGPARAGYVQTDDLLPSPEYTGGAAVYADGIMARNISFVNIATRGAVPPGGGAAISSFFDIYTEVSLNGGMYWQTYLTHGQGSWLFMELAGGPPTRTFGAEMTSMTISGGDLPSGVLIRESPTLQSQGLTTLTAIGGGNYDCDSFFDIWTEISTDGALSWRPSGQSMHMIGTPEPATLSLLALGGLALVARSRRRA